MSARSGMYKLTRVACRGLQLTRASRAAITHMSVSSTICPLIPKVAPIFAAGARSLSSSLPTKNITPDNGEVERKETPKPIQTPAQLTDPEYHAVADEYLDRLLYHLEELAEEKEDVDVEYSSGVMTVTFGNGFGTYVINKQPPNKQIWLSSPKSGPKRYDYVILGDSFQDKQDTASGDWIYLRDGTTLSQLFKDEINLDIRMPTGPYDGEADHI